jgi:signal transduction histidine kinase
VPIGVGFGVAVEWVLFESSLNAALTAADFIVGCLLIGCGVLAWDRRPENRVGALMTLAGFTWFAGNLGSATVYLHRGPLVHLVLSYPTGRLRGRAARIVVALAYVDALVRPLASNDTLTLVLAVAVAFAALRSSEPASRVASLGLSAALALTTVDRLADLGHSAALLWIYDALIASIAVFLTFDLLLGARAEATARGLVVDLGAIGGTTGLRDRLARALGDPSLVVGYRRPGTREFVDDEGSALVLPTPGSGRTATRLERDHEEIGVLVHDEALHADQQLVETVAAAAQLAMANALLQAETREQAVSLETSRRRIVEAIDRERRRLEQELHVGPQRLLADAAATLERVGGPAATIEHELAEARQELRELAQGLRPAALTKGGLLPALTVLAERSPLPVRVRGDVGRQAPAVEAALYFVCSEGLANAVKHADATAVSIAIDESGSRVRATVSDDGVGGAALSRGSGLAGLTDRVEALGGTLHVESPRGHGTRIVAELPFRVSGRGSRAR